MFVPLLLLLGTTPTTLESTSPDGKGWSGAQSYQGTVGHDIKMYGDYKANFNHELKVDDTLHFFQSVGALMEPAGQYLDYAGTIMVPFSYGLPRMTFPEGTGCTTFRIDQLEALALNHIQNIIGAKETGKRTKRFIPEVISVLSGALGVWNTMEINSLKDIVDELENNKMIINEHINTLKDSTNKGFGKLNSVALLVGDHSKTLNKILRKMKCMGDIFDTTLSYITSWYTFIPQEFISAYDGAITGKLVPELVSGTNLRRLISVHPELDKTLYSIEPSLVYELGKVLLTSISLEGVPMLQGVILLPKLINQVPSALYNVYTSNFNYHGLDTMILLPQKVVCSYNNNCWEPDHSRCVKTDTRVLCLYGIPKDPNECLGDLFNNSTTRCMYKVRTTDGSRPIIYQTSGGILVGTQQKPIKVYKKVNGISQVFKTIPRGNSPYFITKTDGEWFTYDDILYSVLETGIDLTVNMTLPVVNISGVEQIAEVAEEKWEHIEDIVFKNNLIGTWSKHSSLLVPVLLITNAFVTILLVAWTCRTCLRKKAPTYSEKLKFIMDFQPVDSHLQSPIRPDERQLLVQSDVLKIPVFFRGSRLTLGTSTAGIRIDSEVLYGIIFSQIYDDSMPKSEWVKNNLPNAFEVSKEATIEILKTMLPGHEIKAPDLTPEIYRWVTTAIYWEELRINMQHARTEERWKYVKKTCKPFTKIRYCSRFALLTYLDVDYLMGYDQIMMISDTMWSRANALSSQALSSSLIPGKVDPEVICESYRYFDGLFWEKGNELFSAIKSWEPIITSLTIKKTDPYPGWKEYIEPVLMEQKKAGFDFLEEIWKDVDKKDLTVDQLTEIFGIYRHWGHPTVDEEGGCLKVQDIVHNRPNPKISTLVKIDGCLKRQFVISFMHMHSRWPHVMNLTSLKNSYLVRMIEENARHIDLYQAKITLEDWHSIEFGKEHEFDQFLDYTELIDDKAIAPYRSEVRSLYNSDVLGYRSPKSKTSRRLLKAILEVAKLDIDEIIRKIRLREVPQEWFTVILHSKERELKLKPRLFAMLVLEMRMYFCVTEKNIADHIFPYFPQQSMTLTEAELSKRMYSFSSSEKEKNYVPFYYGIDFKSWNLHWTKHSTGMTFSLIDQIFGTPGLYTFTHEFFQKSLIALSSSLHPPTSVKGSKNNKKRDPEACECLWYDHDGGFEGLRQKGWTLATIGLLLLVEHETGIKSMIIGQGDNQICKVFIPKRDSTLSDEDFIKQNQDYLKKKLDEFITCLNKNGADIGLVIKPDESLISHTTVIYGKDILVQGAYKSQGTKKLSRTLPDINEVYPSIATKVSTLATAGLAAAQKSHSPIVPCIWSSTLVILHTIFGSQYSQISKVKIKDKHRSWIESKDGMLFLLLGCPDIGGAPIQNILNYLYRGHPDHLTSYTTFLRLFATTNQLAKKVYLFLQRRKYELGDADPELLIANPCSTNIKSYPLLSSRFRKHLEEVIVRTTKNQHLKQLFPKNTAKLNKELFEFLIKHHPLHPRLLHELFRLTPVGVRLAFLAKFSNTRTAQSMFRTSKYERVSSWEMIEMADEFSEEDFSNRYLLNITDIDHKFVEHIGDLYKKVLTMTDLDEKLIDPAVLAQDMRDHSWNDLLKNRKIEGVTLPHPAYQFKFSVGDPINHDHCKGDSEYISYTVVTTDSFKFLTTRGPYPVYVGSRTKEKISGKIYSIPINARPLKAAERSIQLSTWCVDKESSLYQFMMDLAQSRTDIPLDTLKLISGYICSGAMPHRLIDHVTKNGSMINSIANGTTHVLFSTDPMGRLSRGGDNYAIHFQGAILFGYSLIGILACNSPKLNTLFHLHYDGLECEEQIPDVMIGGTYRVPSLQHFSENPLLFTKGLDVKEKDMKFFDGFIKKSHNDSGWAVAHILLGRVRVRIGTLSIGMSDHSAPLSSAIGIQEVLRIGVPSIITNLAILLYLHLDYDDNNIGIFLHSFPRDIWDDITSIILLPEVLPLFSSFIDVDGIADLYSKKYVVSNMLTESLIKNMYKIMKDPTKLRHLPPFHLTKQLRINQILRMWGKLVFIKSGRDINLKFTIRKIIEKYLEGMTVSDNVAKTPLAYIMVRMLLKHVPQHFNKVWGEHRLQLTYQSPESLLRIQPFIQLKIPKISPVRFSKTNLHGSNYISRVAWGHRSLTLSKLECYIDAPARMRTEKLRADHIYRLIGQVSTAYLKYLEIIIREEIDMHGNAMCIADGEASVAKMCNMLTGNPVIHNTLVDVTNLPPQRGYQYIPGAFISDPSQVLGGQISATTGGDITNPTVQKLIIQLAKDNNFHDVCLLTCDAEVSATYSPILGFNITKAVCTLGLCLSVKNVIYKTFLQDTHATTSIGALLHTIWGSVKLVVPTFSSYESTEAFYVCTNFDPIITEEKLSTYHHDNFYGTESSFRFLDSVEDLISSRELTQVPFQQKNLFWTQQLLDHGKQLGFKTNIGLSFRAISNYTLFYKEEEPIKRQLEDGLKIAKQYRQTYSDGMSLVYEGRSLNKNIGAITSQGTNVHGIIETYITCEINLKLTLRLIEGYDDYDHAMRLIHETLLETVDYLNTDDSRLYTYSEEDPQAWKRKYLKHVWKVIGHYRNEQSELF